MDRLRKCVDVLRRLARKPDDDSPCGNPNMTSTSLNVAMLAVSLLTAVFRRADRRSRLATRLKPASVA